MKFVIEACLTIFFQEEAELRRAQLRNRKRRTVENMLSNFEENTKVGALVNASLTQTLQGFVPDPSIRAKFLDIFWLRPDRENQRLESEFMLCQRKGETELYHKHCVPDDHPDAYISGPAIEYFKAVERAGKNH